jgi:signal transduction histidine kinase
VSRRGISARWFLPAALLTLLAVPAAVATGVWFMEAQRQQDDLDRRLAQASTYIGGHVSPETTSLPRAQLQGYLDRLGMRTQLTLVTPDGKSIVYVSPALLDPNAAKKIAATIADGIKGMKFDPGIAAGQASLPHTTVTIPGEATAQGGMLVADLYHAPLDRTFRALLALAAGSAVLLLGLATAVWLAGRWIVKPLRHLSVQVDRIAGGERALATTPSRVSEVATVSAALSDMAAALERNVERDARIEEARRFLVTAVAHDLRTPLFSLRGYLEAIASGIGDADDYLPRAQAKAAQLDRLVGGLFAYARDEYLDEAPLLAVADLGQLVSATLAGFELAMLPRGVTYRATGDEGVLALLDRERLERVLGNLVDNAVRYSPPGGTIEVAWEARDGFAYVTIADEGPGIAAEDLPRIFDPAYRSDGSRNSHTGGAGLGLTIARRLIEIQGGSIDARNRDEGGAVFTVRLEARTPAVEVAPGDQRAVSSWSAPAGR